MNIFSALKFIIGLSWIAASIVIVDESKQAPEMVTMLFIVSITAFLLSKFTDYVARRVTNHFVDMEFFNNMGSEYMSLSAGDASVGENMALALSQNHQATSTDIPYHMIPDSKTGRFQFIVMQAWVNAFQEKMGSDATAECGQFLETSVGISGTVTITGDVAKFSSSKMKAFHAQMLRMMRSSNIDTNGLVIDLDVCDVNISLTNKTIAMPSYDDVIKNANGFDSLSIGVDEHGEPVCTSELAENGSVFAFIAGTGMGKTVAALSALGGIMSTMSPDELCVSFFYVKTKPWESSDGRYHLWTQAPHIASFTGDPAETIRIINEVWDNRDEMSHRYHILFIDDLKDMVKALHLADGGRAALARLGTIATSGREYGLRIFITTQVTDNTSDVGDNGLYVSMNTRWVGFIPDKSTYTNACGKDKGANRDFLSGKRGDGYHVEGGQSQRVLIAMCEDVHFQRYVLDKWAGSTPNRSAEPSTGISETDFASQWHDIGDNMTDEEMAEPHEAEHLNLRGGDLDYLEPFTPSLEPCSEPDSEPCSEPDSEPCSEPDSEQEPDILSEVASLLYGAGDSPVKGDLDGIGMTAKDGPTTGDETPATPNTTCTPRVNDDISPKYGDIGGGTPENTSVFIENTSAVACADEEDTSKTPAKHQSESELVSIISGANPPTDAPLDNAVVDAVKTLHGQFGYSQNRLIQTIWKSKNKARATIIKSIIE